MKPIPKDIFTGKVTFPVRSYPEFSAISEVTKKPLSSNELLKHILRNTDIDILLKSIGTAFAGRPVTVTTSPTLIIPKSKQPRGYIIINPTSGVGLTTSSTLFPSAVYTTAGSPYTSTSLGVANYMKAHLYLNVTAVTGPPTIAVDIETYDPVSGTWGTALYDIFGSPSAIGTYYAYIGEQGMADTIRAKATLSGGTDATFSLSIVLKEGVAGSASGTANNVYIGGPDVNSTHGYVIMEGQKEVFFLRENVELYAIADSNITIKIFELQ
jgi:hypothetical protein